MKSICRSIWFGGLGVLGVAVAGQARGAEGPLLVSVEVAPGVDVGPADVRRTIASELGVPVVGAREPTAGDASDVLLVTVEPGDVRMSLRARATPVVTRVIAAPADRPGRLQSIGWLAGNLVRDQVGPLIATASAAAPPAAEAHAPTEPPPMPVAASPPDAAAPAAVVASRPSARDETVPHARWAITAGGGPTLNATYFDPRLAQSSAGTAYHIEVQYQSAPDSMLFGAVVESGPEAPVKHYFGGALFAGSSWRRRAWFVEANLGLGVEAVDGRVTNMTFMNASDMLGTVEQTTVSFQPIPQLYARVAGGAGVALTQTFDLVAQLGVHLSTGGEGGSFLSSAIGLRLRLP